MRWTLIRKEIVSHVLSLRFGVTFILFILLVFASIYVTTREYERDMAQFAAGERSAMDHLAEIMKVEDLGRRARRLMRWGGRLDAVPVPPLSSVAQGLRPSMPISLHTNKERSRNIGRGSDTNPLAGMVRIPDMVYIVSVVLSLLAILFAFDSICGEKESGTLRLMLANPVPRDSILLGKWVGGYVVLVLPFLIAAIGGLGYAWQRGALEASGENLQRLAALLAVACLYISVFFTLSLFVSATTHRAATALFLCLLIWVAWILVVPNLAPVVAKIVSPAPSVEKINAEKRAVDKETNLRIRRMALTSGELYYGRESRQKQEAIRKEGNHRKRQWDRFLDEAMSRQTGLAETLGRLSPSVCWTYAATALTDTGPEAFGRFEQGRKRLHEDFEEYANALRQQRNNSGSWPEVSAGDVPRLHVVWPDLGAAVRSALNDVLILAVLNVVFFMGAFVLFLRYDVR